MARVHSLLLTTTIVAGLGFFGLMPAGAGPNMPNMPSISAPNISPTRPDFNMRAPNALRDRDLASPRDPASLTPKKSKRDPKPYMADTKAKKKNSDTASRARSAPGAIAKSDAKKSGGPAKSSASGDRGVIPGEGPVFDNLRAHLDKIGANADEYRRIKELVELLLTGPQAAGYVPGAGDRGVADPKGDLTSRFSRPINPQGSDKSGWDGLEKFPTAPRYGGGGSQREHSGGVFGWGPGGAPPRFNDPSGQVSNDWHRVSRTQNGRTSREYWKNSETGQSHTITTTSRRVITETYTPGSGTQSAVYRIGADLEREDPTSGSSERGTLVIKMPFVFTAGEPSGATEGAAGAAAGSGNSPDDQPVAEGTGRPSGGGYEVALQLRGGRRIVCDFFGCRESAPTAGRIGDPGRNNPEGTSTVIGTSGPSTGPGAATDPCPDCGPTRTGGGPPQNLRPSDVGWTGSGGGGRERGGSLVPLGSGAAGTSGSRP
jgi:hypothetical protein